ncbi:MAG: hypothetical protein NTZ34_01560 [Chloroflexi bacterium]|nr:hypothetical protein [Chloroflexota bacterium]
MTKKAKREQKIRDNPYNVSLEDFEALVNQYGHIKEGGKHPKVVIGKEMLSYKRRNPVYKEYVEYVLTLINAFKKSGETNEQR